MKPLFTGKVEGQNTVQSVGTYGLLDYDSFFFKLLPLRVHFCDYQNDPLHGDRTNTIPLQTWTGPWGSESWDSQRFQTVGTRRWQCCLSALCTVRLYASGYTPGTYFCQRLSRTQGHSAAGEIKGMKNPNDSIEPATFWLVPFMR